MQDSLNEEEKQRKQKAALKFALRPLAGHINSRTPVAIAVAAALKNRPSKEEIKSGSVSLDNLSPIDLHGTLGSIHPDWYTWLPETIWNEFPCNDTTKNKIRAIQTVLTTPDTQFDVDAFSHILEAFNGHIPDWSILHPLPCEEIVYGWNQLKLIRKDFELWPDVINYIKACMQEDGLVWLPWLDIEFTNGVEFPLTNLKIVWDKLKDTTLKINIEDPLHVQIANLQDIAAYLKAMP